MNSIIIDYWRLQNESQTPPYNLCKETAAVNIKEKLREIGIILVSAWRSLISLLFLGQAIFIMELTAASRG